jgi:hypothetical protein
VRDGWDDEELVTALREAMRAREAVPAEFIEMGRNAYAWHNIDAELAQLTYDSDRDADLVASLRSETASVRALTFTSAQLSIEVEVTDDSLVGQVVPIVPEREGTIEVQAKAGATTTTSVDEIGCFAVSPKPASPFRLRYRAADGTDVVTGWITLLRSACAEGYQ